MPDQNGITPAQGMGALASKINAITEELGAVAQDGQNNKSNYGYITYEQMNCHMRKLLPKHRLSIIPAIEDIRETQYVTSKGTPGVRTLVKGSFMIIDCDTGFFIERKFVGGDQDVGGKSGGQAVTECTKRFLLKLFHVSSKGDVDPDSQTVEGGIPPAQQGGFNNQQSGGGNWGDGF